MQPRVRFGWLARVFRLHSKGAEDAPAGDQPLTKFARRVFQASVESLPEIAVRRLKQAREKALDALDAGD